jgi:serine/threonine protein kinase
MEHTSLYPDRFLRLYFHDTRDDYIFILMDYVPTGDCLQLMKSMDGKLPLELAKHIVASLVLAVSFLHSHGVVHRDIKPDNLLITPQGNVKLVDFGMSTHYDSNTDGSGSENNSLWLKEMHNASGSTSAVHALRSETDMSISSYRFGDRCDDDLMKTLVGNVNYAAPEVLEGEGYDHSIDWWAVGVLYFHFIGGVPPFHARSDSEIKYNVIEGIINWEKVPINTHASCKSFIAALLERKSKRRLGATGGKAVERHDHFQGINFSTLLSEPGPFLPTVEEIEFKPLDLDFLA